MSFSVAWARALRPRPYHAAAALFFVVLGLAFYGPWLNELPSGIHTWAQTDRLSLALNFYDFGLDFFTPRTSSLISIGGVTGVEFPLQAYLAALGGVVFGRDSIVTNFRVLDVAATVLGFYYLFRLVFERTQHFVAGLVPGVFLLASPFYAFYAGGFLPDPFSLAISFVGYYYWARFFDSRHFGDLRVAILVLALAGLLKTTTALHLAAVAGITLLWAFLQPDRLSARQRLEFLGWTLGAFGLIIGFFVHNQHLNTAYQSEQFLAEARPIADPETYHDVLLNVRRSWLGEYATVAQYRILGVCAVLLLAYLGRNLRVHRPLLLLLLAAVGIAGVFVQLMGTQLGAHDYYLICAAIPPAVLVLVLALLNLGQYTGAARYVTSLGLGIMIFFLGANGYKRLQRRSSDDYPPFSPWGHLWMRGGAAEMARAGVPAAAGVLYFNELPPNIAPVYFDRHGLTWIPPTVRQVTAEDFLRRMALDSLDYAVADPRVFAQIAPENQPGFAASFETVGRSPAIVLRRRERRRSW